MYNRLKNGLKRLYLARREPEPYSVIVPENIDYEIEKVLRELNLSDEEIDMTMSHRKSKKDNN
jgi:hypothetical protein